MCSCAFLDTSGHPSFQALQHRSAHPNHTIVFYAFDLLHLDGEDLTMAPLKERRARLPGVLESSGLLLSRTNFTARSLRSPKRFRGWASRG